MSDRVTASKREACGLCGRDPAAGWALVGDVRYCHGDLDPEPTCYMRAQMSHPDIAGHLSSSLDGVMTSLDAVGRNDE